MVGLLVGHDRKSRPNGLMDSNAGWNGDWSRPVLHHISLGPVSSQREVIVPGVQVWDFGFFARLAAITGN